MNIRMGRKAIVGPRVKNAIYGDPVSVEFLAKSGDWVMVLIGNSTTPVIITLRDWLALDTVDGTTSS